MELSPFTNILIGDHVTNLIEHADDAMWDVDALRVAFKRCILSYLLRVNICFIMKTWGNKWISSSMYGYTCVFYSRSVVGPARSWTYINHSSCYQTKHTLMKRLLDYHQQYAYFTYLSANVLGNPNQITPIWRVIDKYTTQMYRVHF